VWAFFNGEGALAQGVCFYSIGLTKPKLAVRLRSKSGGQGGGHNAAADSESDITAISAVVYRSSSLRTVALGGSYILSKIARLHAGYMSRCCP